MCCPVWVSSRHCPHPHPQSISHTQAGTKRPTSVWPYQCHCFVWQSFRVHEVSLATARSIAQPTVQQLAAAAAVTAQSSDTQADQTSHVVRCISLIYLCTLCINSNLFSSRWLGCICWAENWMLQLRCNIDKSPFSWKCPRGPFKVFRMLCWARSLLTVTSVGR